MGWKGWGRTREEAWSLVTASCNSDLSPLTVAGVLTVSVLVRGMNKSRHF